MAPNDTGARIVRTLIALAGTLVAAFVGWILFLVIPDSDTVLGVVLFVAVVVLGVRFASNIAASLVPPYSVAEVAVEGPITRDGNLGGFPPGRGTPADDIVDQIEAADADDGARALVLKLNTPGGEVLPSDDIRAAAEAFDGPTVAYATDVCASGGYWIASGCDELWARDASIVGSIGVIGSRVNASEFAEELGFSYERFAAGEFKDAGTPLKELSEDDRAYLQGLIDDYYEDFVERVAEGRGMDPEAIRDTEARVYLGEEAHDLGLVDTLGDREAVLDAVAERIGEDAIPAEFTPQPGLTERIRLGAQGMAYAVGAGAASRFGADEEGFRFRL